jgi:curved DNA-binding protein CbpA
MSTPLNPYGELGVPEAATSAEISRRFHDLARVLHPDVGRIDPLDPDRFSRMTAAHNILKNKTSRDQLDRRLREERAREAREYQARETEYYAAGGARFAQRRANP